MFLAAPPLPAATVSLGAADQGAGTIIGGTIDPARTPQLVDVDDSPPEVVAPAIDLTNETEFEVESAPELPVEVPIAPITRAERPLECEVHLRFGDRWIDGFQIEETIHGGPNIQFRLRRRVDGWVLPELFDESEVRVFMQPVVDPSRT